MNLKLQTELNLMISALTKLATPAASVDDQPILSR